MIAVPRALTLAWGDLLRPALLGVIGKGIGLTLLLLVALQGAIFAALWRFGPEILTLPLIGTVPLGHALSWGSLGLLPVLGFFLMAPVAAAMAGLFTEEVAAKVEAIHYPSRPGRSLDGWDAALDGLAMLGAVLGAGLVLLVVTPFIGPLAPVAFYGVNGWLLGREFFALAARRHLRADEAAALRRARGGAVLSLGVTMALLLTVPLLNIVVPVLAAAAFTHLFHGVSGRSGQTPSYPHG